MPDNTPEVKTWEVRFKKLMGTLPMIPDEMRNNTCLVCGHPFDKSLEYLKLKAFIQSEIASAKAEGKKDLKKELLGKIPKAITPDKCYPHKIALTQASGYNKAIWEITDLINNI